MTITASKETSNCDAPSSREEPSGQLVRLQDRLSPKDDRARIALKAIDEKRFDDAERHISALSVDSPINRAWMLCLRGRLEWTRHNLERTKSSLLECIESLEPHAQNVDQRLVSDFARISAAAHDLLGSVFRRQDRPSDAYQHHFMAYQLREKHGPPHERSESANNLGLDAQIMHDWPDAVQWHQQAISHAAQSHDFHLVLLADLWTHLAHALLEVKRYVEAINASRTARDLWFKADPTTQNATLADVRLGLMLSRVGQSLGESGTEDPKTFLDEASQVLEKCCIALAAFGSDMADEHRRCSEHYDFVLRLKLAFSTGE